MVIHVFRHNVVYNSNIKWSTFQKIQKGEIFLDMDMSVSTYINWGPHSALVSCNPRIFEGDSMDFDELDLANLKACFTRAVPFR